MSAATTTINSATTRYFISLGGGSRQRDEGTHTQLLHRGRTLVAELWELALVMLLKRGRVCFQYGWIHPRNWWQLLRLRNCSSLRLGMKKVSLESKEDMALGLQVLANKKLVAIYTREKKRKKKFDHTYMGSHSFLKHMEGVKEKGENPTYISYWNNMCMCKDKSLSINEAAEIKGKKMNEEYKKAKQQVAESLGTPLDQIALPIPQQLEIMTAELGVAKGKRIRGLGSSLRVESSHSG
ncbi:uncharacterized protein Pyn_22859 [Prunus yedoensis var. nudiflora]|uniref:Uncharacterized protein n=1 Tax=Prunus yedoensis var. nudiflora TaxID=2094558 RepID=A0A314Y8T1_PRUYE|nr:uncharacterized protein Pyn_22859 [Prunus yedoensis var. nudiflora]